MAAGAEVNRRKREVEGLRFWLGTRMNNAKAKGDSIEYEVLSGLLDEVGSANEEGYLPWQAGWMRMNRD